MFIIIKEVNYLAQEPGPFSPMASQKFPVERENNTLNRLRDIIDNLTSPGSFEVLEGYISSHTIDTDIL